MSHRLIIRSLNSTVYDGLKLMYEKRSIIILESEIDWYYYRQRYFRSSVNDKEVISTTIGVNPPIAEYKLIIEI